MGHLHLLRRIPGCRHCLGLVVSCKSIPLMPRQNSFPLRKVVLTLFVTQPETKGATLEDMDRVFNSRTGAEDAAMLAQARRDVGLIVSDDDSSLLKVQDDSSTTEKKSETKAHIEAAA